MLEGGWERMSMQFILKAFKRMELLILGSGHHQTRPQ